MSVTGLVGMNAALAAPFYDNFDRPDSTTVGNGWTPATNPGNLQPQITSSQVAFITTYHAGHYAYASINHTFDAASEVSVELKWVRGQTWDESMGFSLTGSITDLMLYDRPWNATGSYYPITVVYKGAEIWLNVTYESADVYRKYKVTTGGGSTRVYVDDALLWTSPDAGIGLVTASNISAQTQYWPWDAFYADNFAATIPEPASLGLGALGLLRRRR